MKITTYNKTDSDIDGKERIKEVVFEYGYNHHNKFETHGRSYLESRTRMKRFNMKMGFDFLDEEIPQLKYESMFGK